MRGKIRSARLAGAVAVAAAIGTAVLVDSTPSVAAPVGSAHAAAAPVNVGMVYEKTGIYSAYATEYQQGFNIGMRYVTHGTGKVDGHHVNVTWDDDADSSTTAINDFKSFVGAGDKIIGGTIDSGIGTQLAPLAAQNHVLYIAGSAAADQLTGANQYTFRSGRQTYQDVMAAKSYVANAGRGKKIVVLAQDYAFGESYVTDAKRVFGKLHDKVTPILVPLTTTDFTPTALQVKALHPSLIFLAWAGTTGAALAQALDQQGVFSNTKVVTGLANIATYPFYGKAGLKFDYISLYVYQGSKTPPNLYLIKQMKKQYGSVPDLFCADGFVGAQMVARAIQTGGGTNVKAMIKGLDGWSFLAPKGVQVIRPSDHAMLQPMYLVKLVDRHGTYTPIVTKTLGEAQTAPAPRPIK
ncbi:MAG: substrate-binding domain-containing protein [Solirubrobacteraceae bacterium]